MDAGEPTAYVSPDQAELALAALVELAAQDSFLVEVFVNYDCNPLATDLLTELMIKASELVQASGNPMQDPLACHGVEFLSVCARQLAVRAETHDAAAAALEAAASEPVEDAQQGGRVDAPEMTAAAPGKGSQQPQVVGQGTGEGGLSGPGTPDAVPTTTATATAGAGLGAGAGSAGGAGGADEAHAAAKAEATSQALVESLLAARRRKQLLRRSVTVFARKPKHCFSFLQQVGLLPSPPAPADIAAYLRSTPGLNKTKVGEVLGSGDDSALRKE